MKKKVNQAAPESLAKMMKPLGKAIKTFRLGKRLTQLQLASLIPGTVTQGYLSKIEKGECFPSNAAIQSLVKALGCSNQQLWAMAEAIASAELEQFSKDDFFNCLSHSALGHAEEKVDSFKEAMLEEGVVKDIADLKQSFSAGNRRGNREIAARLKALTLNTDVEKTRLMAFLLADVLETASTE